MITNNLLNLHYQLLGECITQHGKRFHTASSKLAKAHAIVDQAMSANPTDTPTLALQQTVKNTLQALELKKPEHLPRFNHSDLNRQSATTYFSSPITRHFVDNAPQIAQAFSDAATESATQKGPAWTQPKMTRFFATPEHQQLGDGLQIPFIDAEGNLRDIAAKDYRMPIYSLENGKIVENTALKLTAGDIVMLSGDYFGIPKQPIADNTVQSNFKPSAESQERFIQAYNSLAQRSSTEEMQKLLEINKAHYSKNETLNSYLQQLKLLLHNPSYITLLKNNIDHFNPWARQAFESGRACAMELALKAHEAYAKQDYTTANQMMQLSLQYLLYAEHFLSDSFSAGHSRVGDARLIMKEQFGDLGSILINDMHNEDSAHGVYANINGKLTKMTGDDHLNDFDARGNKRAAENAMQAAVDEIREVVSTGKIPEHSKVDAYWPQVPEDDASIPNQAARMFKTIDGKIYYRSPFTELDPNKVSYQPLTWFKALQLVIERRLFGIEAKDSRLQQGTAPEPELRTIAHEALN